MRALHAPLFMASLASTLASPAHADDPSYELAWVRGHRAESCPGGAALQAEIERRLGRKAFQPDADRSFEVLIQGSESGFQSLIHIRTVDGRELGVREIVSDEPNCASIFHATALAIALAIDPNARTDDLPIGTASFTPPQHTGETSAKVAGGAPQAEPSADPPPPVVAIAPRVAEARPVPAIADAPSVRATASAAVGVAVLPAATAGYGLVSSGEVASSWGWEAGMLHLGSAEHSAPGGVAALIGLDAGWLGVAYLPVHGERARLALGLGIMAGVLQVAVTSPDPRDVGSFAHVAARPSARLDVRLAGPLLIELGAGGIVPLSQQRLSVVIGGNSQATWETPAIGVIGTLGLGVMAP